MDRPWVQPEEVKAYSSSAKVKERTDAQLRFDISRAEAYVIYQTHNKFNTIEYATRIPEDVKTAVIVLAEAYAKQAIMQKNGLVSSETLDDYSYTMGSSDKEIADSLGIGVLLDAYSLVGQGKVVMNLRSL